VKEITTTSLEAPAPAAPGPAAPTQAAPRPAAPTPASPGPGLAGPGTPAPGDPAEPAHVDGYSCARAWAALTAAHARIADQLSAALAQGCGLTINGFEILLRLDSAAPPGLRLGELHPAVRLTQPSLSRAVARLGRSGWLTRSGAPDDGRGVLVCITQDGRDVLRRAAGVHAQTISEFLLDPLTPTELDVLARALTRITEN
jgi:DNA-binding MarR family transcriptional regulator